MSMGYICDVCGGLWAEDSGHACETLLQLDNISQAPSGSRPEPSAPPETPTCHMHFDFDAGCEECRSILHAYYKPAVAPTGGDAGPSPNKDKIRAVVEKVLAERYEGPGDSQRLWMVAAVMRGLSELLPFEHVNRVRSCANALAAAGDYELEEQWPK